MKTRKFYEGDRLSQISFPLGGIGSGCIGLAGNGRLIDWEIRNKPSKGSVHGFSHFAVKVEKDGDVVDARVLNGDLDPPYAGTLSGSAFATFGFGVPREYMTGFPHFETTRFCGEFPIASLDFIDSSFPGTIRMTAFNPLLPGNDRDSSIPAAFFEFTIENTTENTLTYTVSGALKNPHPVGTGVNEYRATSAGHQIFLGGERIDHDSVDFGDMTLATDAPEASHQEYWYRGSWFDNVSVYWRDLTTPGRFENRRYGAASDQDGVAYGKEDQATLAAHTKLAPGETDTIRFVISWSFPNVANYWNPKSECCDEGCDCGATWRNYYATLFVDSAATARYSIENWARLWDETNRYRTTLFSSTLPPELIDAVSANVSILKSPTVLRLEDGTFYGFEGCHPSSGCCDGSCTHVWNYAYALPFLFPALERSMRDVDYRYNRDEAGGMAFRLQLPLGDERERFRPCVDGQFGGVMKMYREWKISGDTDWLRSHWEEIKSNIEFAWSDANRDRWDADKDGILEGRQHHTLDMELFGPNSWLTGFYLGALLAAAEMAKELGDADAQAAYRDIFDRGKQRVNQELFNGEYFYHKIDLSDRSLLESFSQGDKSETYRGGRSATSAYWDEEHRQIKYQIADGCAVDQVVAQWHANLMALGPIFDQEKTRSALQSIYRYNFKRTVRHHVNPCRIYALNDEAAVLICAFPNDKPVIAVPYAEEAMNGFEYQAACHMIQEGMVDEGLEIVRAIRDRYDGTRRNPWNEFECGSNYARSMASYSLLLAYSGFEYDMVGKHIGFRPVTDVRPFNCFWSLGESWGEVCIDSTGVVLSLEAGSVELHSFGCSGIASHGELEVFADQDAVDARTDNDVLRFEKPVVLTPERSLRVDWSRSLP